MQPSTSHILRSWALIGFLLLGQTLASPVHAQRPAQGSEAQAGNWASEANAQFVEQIQADTVHWPTLIKTVSLALLILIWVKSSDWVNSSGQRYDLGYRKWNAIVFFPFSIALLVMFFFQSLSWYGFRCCWSSPA